MSFSVSLFTIFDRVLDKKPSFLFGNLLNRISETTASRIASPKNSNRSLLLLGYGYPMNGGQMPVRINLCYWGRIRVFDKTKNTALCAFAQKAVFFYKSSETRYPLNFFTMMLAL